MISKSAESGECFMSGLVGLLLNTAWTGILRMTYCMPQARTLYRDAVTTGVRFFHIIENIFNSRPMASLWHNSFYSDFCENSEIVKQFNDKHMLEQISVFVLITMKCLEQLPILPPSRKRSLALRKWAYGTLEFWTGELKRPITVINDSKNGYSECHRFLRSLLAEIDPESVPKLGTIVRQYRTEQRTDHLGSEPILP
jgi:hypothetical protein